MKNLTDLIKIDPAQEVESIIKSLKTNISKVIKKRGAIIGISGGIDSSVVLALCARAFGPEKVLTVYDAKIGMKGFVVIDNTSFGPGKGGIRIRGKIRCQKQKRI